jgi:hypothetical protein
VACSALRSSANASRGAGLSAKVCIFILVCANTYTGDIANGRYF